MKEFAHPEQAERTTVDLDRAIESALTMARNEYEYVAGLETAIDVGTTFSIRLPVEGKQHMAAQAAH
jgi:hypothetical protein